MWIANHHALIKTDHYYRSKHAHDTSCHATWVSSRMTMVESNMTVSIIYTWLVKNLHNMLFSFALSLVLVFPSWLLLYSDFIAFTFSVSPTSAVFSTQLHKTHRTLWRTSCTVLCILHCQKCYSYLPSTSIISACDAWVSERARKCKWVQIDIRDCDRHIHTYVRTMREFKALC